LKNKIEQIQGVQFVSISNNIPGLELNQTLFEVPGENGELTVAGGQFMTVDYNFFQTLNMELVQGRNFDVATEADFNNNVIINETAVERFNLGPDPLGKQIISGTDSLNNPFKVTVIGVVEDYHMGSLHSTIEPIVTFGIRDASKLLIIKSDGSDIERLMSGIQDNYEATFVDKPFDYTFFDQSFEVLYQSEELLFDVLFVFLMVTLFITCVGLIGLVSYSTEQRKKEVGIRKVLGSDSFSLLRILTKEYVIITLLAFVAAAITSWYGIKMWFETFAYHTSIQWSDYALVLCTFLLIMLMSSVYQIVKAMMANPINIIRSDN
ncbi:MAG: FtsX-like permease family protein, partial [Bacteroidota bacterium]